MGFDLFASTFRWGPVSPQAPFHFSPVTDRKTKIAENRINTGDFASSQNKFFEGGSTIYRTDQYGRYKRTPFVRKYRRLFFASQRTYELADKDGKKGPSQPRCYPVHPGLGCLLPSRRQITKVIGPSYKA